MPIYQYTCQTCGKTFERWSKQIRDWEWKELCPHDGGTGDRILSPTSFQLKGGGWAKDGYSDSKNNSGGNNSSDSST